MNLRKFVPALLLGLGIATLPAFADDTAEPDNRMVRFVLSGGLTYGGDRMVGVVSPNGGPAQGDVKAGGVFQAGTGVLLAPHSVPVSLQLTANYQVDSVSGINGSGTLSRMPMEAIVFYNGFKDWRIGLGARYLDNAHFNLTVDGVTYHEYFRNELNPVIQGGYALSDNVWLELRWVKEDLTIGNNTSALPKGFRWNANHTGLFLTGAF
jgi:hypothetical protein